MSGSRPIRRFGAILQDCHQEIRASPAKCWPRGTNFVHGVSPSRVPCRLPDALCHLFLIAASWRSPPSSSRSPDSPKATSSSSRAGVLTGRLITHRRLGNRFRRALATLEHRLVCVAILCCPPRGRRAFRCQAPPPAPQAAPEPTSPRREAVASISAASRRTSERWDLDPAESAGEGFRARRAGIPFTLTMQTAILRSRRTHRQARARRLHRLRPRGRGLPRRLRLPPC